MATAIVDQEVCIGCGSCVSACPECFSLNENGKSHFVSAECSCDLHEIALNCPVQAITVTDEA